MSRSHRWWVTTNKRPHLFDLGRKSNRSAYSFVYQCIASCKFYQNPVISVTLKLLSYCAFFCYRRIQIALCAPYTPPLGQMSFLITSRKYSFICSVLNLLNSHIYTFTGKTESGADQKLAHGLSLSTSVFQSSFSCKRAKPQGTRWWIFLMLQPQQKDK